MSEEKKSSTAAPLPTLILAGRLAGRGARRWGGGHAAAAFWLKVEEEKKTKLPHTP